MSKYQFAEKNGNIVSIEYDRTTHFTTEQVRLSLEKAFALFPYSVTITQVEDYEDVFHVTYEQDCGMGDIFICAKGTTPGGRSGLKDEQRIQPKAKYLNYVNSKREEGKKAVFLGIYSRDDQDILCTWKVNQSDAASDETPISKQIKITSIANAMKEGFVQQDKGKGVYACAFKPEFLYFYLKNCDWLHTGHVSELSEHKEENQFDEIEDIQESFVDESIRISTGENVLLYGVPGAGKSWTIEHEYCDDDSCMERLVFHPDYMYSDFVGQILPVVRNDKIRYEFIPGPFTKILKNAYENPTKSYYLVIEEINRGNAPAIFGEIFQLLDRKTEDGDGFKKCTSEYGITNINIAKEVYGEPDTKVRIPANLSIIGTMNTSDQNVFTLDTAFQRRWIMRMIPNSFKDHKFATNRILDTDVTWKQFCEAINDEILRRNNITSSEDKRLGAYFVSADDLEIKSIPKGASELEKKKIEHLNSRFAEKVLKYLWDDAFKFSHIDTFDTKKYKSLEMVVEGFTSTTGNNRFRVYHESLRKLIIDGISKDGNIVSDDDATE